MDFYELSGFIVLGLLITVGISLLLISCTVDVGKVYSTPTPEITKTPSFLSPTPVLETSGPVVTPIPLPVFYGRWAVNLKDQTIVNIRQEPSILSEKTGFVTWQNNPYVVYCVTYAGSDIWVSPDISCVNGKGRWFALKFSGEIFGDIRKDE